jgi:hypothetical protein
MNPTTTGGAERGPGENAAHRDPDGADVLPPLPAPRSSGELPRRVRPSAEPGHDPEGRPLGPLDDDTLNRLLSGLREI